METISLKTVYQTLNELAALGEVAALDVGTGTTRFDPNVEECHHHLVCSLAGRSVTFTPTSRLTVPPGATGIRARRGRGRLPGEVLRLRAAADQVETLG